MSNVECLHIARVYSGEYQATLQPRYASICATCGHFEWYPGPARPSGVYGRFVPWKPEKFDPIRFGRMFAARKDLARP